MVRECHKEEGGDWQCVCVCVCVCVYVRREGIGNQRERGRERGGVRCWSDQC